MGSCRCVLLSRVLPLMTCTVAARHAACARRCVVQTVLWTAVRAGYMLSACCLCTSACVAANDVTSRIDSHFGLEQGNNQPVVRGDEAFQFPICHQ